MGTTAALGAATILAALACALFSMGASVLGVRMRRPDLSEQGRRALIVAAVLVTAAAAALMTALLRDDFGIAYVAGVSSRDLTTSMKWAAFYSSQEGSLLYWTWVMSLFFAVFAWVTVPRIPWGGAHATAAAGTVLSAFLLALAFIASPFELSEFRVTDGQGLNPLLVDRGMLVHPPMLLGGFASSAVPFVLAAAALTSGRLDATWIRVVRPWAVLSWLVLSVGNVLGGWWAYTVLGWGGYWGWDPVENSALLPLLPLTAFLHSAMVQERRGMLKSWSLGLAFATFALSVFGTFNVRSGLVASVHSFAQSAIGPYFLLLLAATLVVAVGLLVYRAPRLRPDEELSSLMSRESSMIVNNYVLFAIAAVVLGGTLFPVFSELIDGTRITVGPPFFSQVTGPLLLLLLLVMAAGTVLPWRGATTATVMQRIRHPLLVSAGGALVLVPFGVLDPFMVAGVAIAIGIAFVTLREFVLGARGLRNARRGEVSWPGAVLALFDRDPRRYGGFTVHLAVALMAIAILASNVYEQQVRVSMAPGDRTEFAGYTFVYGGLREEAGTANGVQSEVRATLRVLKDGREVTTLEPGKRFFRNFPGQPSTVVGLHTSPRADLYTFIEGWDEEGVAEIQLFVNPLVMWLWIGAALYAAGGLIAFAPVRSRIAAIGVVGPAAVREIR